MYKHLFGPVPSRRLGMSLGVDLIPRKICSLDCVYCEVGKTTRLTVERKEYAPLDAVTAELRTYFADNPDPDHITFSGSGEPTLHARIGEAIRAAKKLRPDIPVAVLTNGATLSDPAIRASLREADVVLPSLDAATDEVFRRINRPHSSLRIDDCIAGLVAFRNEFPGQIRLEVFILPDYNDSDRELAALKAAIERIRPDEVQINTLDRPGVLPDLRAATAGELRRVLDVFGMDNATIVAAGTHRQDSRDYRTDVATAIVETIARRPCTLDDLSRVLGLHVNEINKYLDVLEEEKKIEAVRRERGLFYQRRKF